MNRFIKAAHIMFACLWLGASSSIVVLQCLRGWPEDARELAALNLDFALLDVPSLFRGL